MVDLNMALLWRLARRGILGLAVGAILVSPASADKASSDLSSLRKAFAAAEEGDCKTALRLISPRLKSPADLPDDLRAGIAELAVSCALDMRQQSLAYDYVMDGTKLAHASDWLWRIRLAIELETNRFDAAVTTIAAMTQGRGAALNGAPVDWMFRLDNALRDAGNVAARRRLLSILVDSSYDPVEPVPVADQFRRRYAELLYDNGEKEAAIGLIRQIDTPVTVMALSLDPRFRAAVPANYNARAGMTAFLGRLEQIASRHPESLDVVIEIASAQRQLGEPQKALATLRASDPTAADAPDFADKNEKINWWWDAIARTHDAAGEYEPLVAAMRQGVEATENGQPNVSQTINLAEAQLRYGHFEDALATLAVFDRQKMPLSPYGEMEMRFARGCATKLAGKDPVADITFVKAHVKDNPGALSALMLCVGDLDGAAASFIMRLDDPARRVSALIDLSDFDPPSKAVPPDPAYSRIPALKERADMKAAIAKAGGTRTFNVQRGDM